MSKTYDLAIIGARIAGASLAILAARAGLRVIAVDKSTFPSNKVPCTHTTPAGAIRVLQRLGVYDDFIKAGACPIERLDFITSHGRMMGEIRENGKPTHALQLRRYVMDRILVEHARKAGAEVRENFLVRELIREGERIVGFRGENGFGSVEEIRARLVVAADGRRSLFGHESPFVKNWPCNRFYYYQYFEPRGTIDPVILCWDDDPDIVCIAPIGEGLWLGMVAPHASKFDEFVVDLQENFNKWLCSKEEIRELVANSKPISRIWGRGNLINTYRDPVANGLVLLGDSGLDIDPLAAQGIAWAFISAEILADVLAKCFKSGDLSPAALAEFRAQRDARLLEYFKHFTTVSLTRKRSEREQEFMSSLVKNPDLASDLVGIWHMTVLPSSVFGADIYSVPVAEWRSDVVPTPA